MEERKNKFYNKWWFWVCIVTIVLIIAITILAIVFYPKSDNHNKEDLSESEIVEYLQDKGYKFTANKSTSTTVTTYYIYVNNDNITFQRIDNPYTGTMYCWKNDNINDEWADILESEENTTEDEKKQYEAYLKWLNKINLSKSQIIDILDYYHENNDGFESFTY